MDMWLGRSLKTWRNNPNTQEKQESFRSDQSKSWIVINSFDLKENSFGAAMGQLERWVQFS